MNLAESTVENALRVLEPVKTQRRVGSRDCARMVRAARNGDSIVEIARDTGFIPDTIRVHLKLTERRTGEKLLPGKSRRTHDRRAILRDYNRKRADGSPLLTRREICETHGCSEQFLRELIKGRLEP